jgi:hypothetical protein
VLPTPAATAHRERIGTVDESKSTGNGSGLKLDTRSVEKKLIGVGGDPFVAAATPLAEMTPSQRDKALREHYAAAYRSEIRVLAAQGLLDSEAEDKDE